MNHIVYITADVQALNVKGSIGTNGEQSVEMGPEMGFKASITGHLVVTAGRDNTAVNYSIPVGPGVEAGVKVGHNEEGFHLREVTLGAGKGVSVKVPVPHILEGATIDITPAANPEKPKTP